jgi:high-affinity nickel-transport protein
MIAFAGSVAVLHIVGWGLFWLYASRYPALSGLGPLAYSLGLRHAFDADHIAAIDNTTRKLRQEGHRPLGVGFFFSLGHSTVVLVLVAALAAAAQTVGASMPVLQSYGRYIGGSISGTFLCLIGVLNLLVLIQLVRLFAQLRRGAVDQERLEQRLLDRGLVSRFLLGRVSSRLRSSWQLYPLGLLFGLSFDTATEVGLLALAAGAATHRPPFLAVISLPLVFAAGMSAIDTGVGAFMSHAYGWTFTNPLRRVFVNVTLTSLSVAVALLVGTIELLQVVGLMKGVNVNSVGYAMVVLFIVTSAAAALVWKTARLDERWGAPVD